MAPLLARSGHPLYSLATEKPKSAKKQGVISRGAKHAATMIELVKRPANPSLIVVSLIGCLRETAEWMQ